MKSIYQCGVGRAQDVAFDVIAWKREIRNSLSGTRHPRRPRGSQWGRREVETTVEKFGEENSGESEEQGLGLRE